MALKLAVANKVSVPVKFDITDDGKIKRYTFSLICDRVSGQQFDADIKDDKGAITDDKIREKMIDIITGWKDQNFIMDDDAPADFSIDALTMMLGVPGVLHAVFTAYLVAASAKTKN